MSLITDLKKKYKDFDLEIPRLEFPDQGITVLWGRSGSGKSTLLQILAGLEDCPGMRWDFAGVSMHQLSPGDRRVGFVFQNYELFPHLTALENIQFAAEARKMSKPQFEDKFSKINSMLQLQSFLGRKSEILSGGEKQRVAMARALMSHPRILFFDEPFTSLDEELRSEARVMLKNIVKQENIPALLVTHDERDVKALADSVIKIEKGRITH